jgi:hypothetical protein
MFKDTDAKVGQRFPASHWQETVLFVSSVPSLQDRSIPKNSFINSSLPKSDLRGRARHRRLNPHFTLFQVRRRKRDLLTLKRTRKGKQIFEKGRGRLFRHGRGQ